MKLSPIRLSAIRKIEDYLTDFGISGDAFGRLALGDNKFWPRLRDPSKNLTLHRLELALAFVDGERAADAAARQVTGRAAEYH